MTTYTVAGRPALTMTGLVTRGLGWLVLAVLLVLPFNSIDFAQSASLAAIYAMTGLSLNIIIGYTGQLSLGHQGFLGVGALVAGNLVANQNLPFVGGLVGGAIAGAVAALLLGLVALRITGLYLSLITLVFGLAVASSLFQLGRLTRNGSGLLTNRPSLVTSNGRYYLLCLAVLALVFYLDVCLTRSKTGRALLALKENERVAEAFGINVTLYKLIAFGLAGAIVGLAGGLYVFQVQSFSGAAFEGNTGLNLALLFVVMVVVGGLGNRVGVAIGGVFFALLDYLLDKLFTWHPFMGVAKHIPVLDGYYGPNKGALAGLIGAVLLLQTLIFNPGGIGQAVGPIQRWLKGQPFTLHDPSADSGIAAVEGSSVRA
jgi:branched-chain amino acid transport system permease protein